MLATGCQARNPGLAVTSISASWWLSGTLKDKLRGEGIYLLLTGIGYAPDVIPWSQADFEGRAAYLRASFPASPVRDI